MNDSQPRVTRRRSLQLLGAGSLTALAGCTGIRERAPFIGDDGDDDELHEHGYLFAEIDGEEVDFSDPNYLEEESDDAAYEFHFHDYDEDERWHMHEIRLTLSEALDLLPGVDSTTDGDAYSLSIEGESYTDGENASITATERDAGEIDPDSYELHDGDVIEIVIESE